MYYKVRCVLKTNQIVVNADKQRRAHADAGGVRKITAKSVGPGTIAPRRNGDELIIFSLPKL